jgi:WD40 repeat protein/serine/threonine protein kinase
VGSSGRGERNASKTERFTLDDADTEDAPTVSEAETPERRDPGACTTGTMVDHFQLTRPIGSGGMGQVWLARDTKLGRRVALKLVRSDLLRSSEAKQLFYREARTTARFNHPNIVGIYAVGEHHGTPYVALEYVEGETLRDRLDRGPLSHAEALRIGAAIADALSEAHRHGVLHRDLKPGNTLIGSDGRVRLLDFGLALTVSLDDAITQSAADIEQEAAAILRGTPQYMSPEQWLGEPNTPATDTWALGQLLFELFSNELPFDGDSLHALAQLVCGPAPAPRLDNHADVEQELADLVEACLSKDPEERPDSGDVASLLGALLTRGRGPLAPGGSPFRGLLPFREQHAGLYFGRDREVDSFVERLRWSAVLPIVGPSGAGKTSFLMAGVIPRLREQERWVVLRLRPGSQPFNTLAVRLLSWREQPSTASEVDASNDGGASLPQGSTTSSERVDSLANKLRERPGYLALALRKLADKRSAKVLLVIDQLEEVYTLCDDADARGRFIELVCSAADDAEEPVRVVFTVREDFLGRLATGAMVRSALRDVTVLERPSPDVLQQMLEGPAAAAGYTFEDPEMAEQMARAVANEPGGLPLLSFAADRLWELRDHERKLLLRSAYESIGGVEGALAMHADGVLDGLTSAETAVARSLLLRLVTVERTRRVSAYADVIDGLPAGAEDIVHKLVEARLLVILTARSDADADQQLELAHESLVTGWPTLARWIDESREDIAFFAEVNHAAARWHKRERAPDGLWHGDVLTEALRIQARSDKKLPEQARAFLAASVGLHRRNARRRRLLVGAALAILTTASVMLAILSGRLATEKHRAEEQRSEALIDGARTALRHGDVLEARAKLRAAFEQHDSTAARALWWQVARDPLLWRKELGVSARSVAIAPTGDLVAVGCDDGSLHLVDRVSRATRVLRGHADVVQHLAFSSDGKQLATADLGGRVLVWDVGQRKLLHDLAGGGGVLSVAFVPGGTKLLTGGRDGKLRLWELPRNASGRVLFQSEGELMTIAAAPDGRYAVAGDSAGEVAVIGLDDASVITTLHPAQGASQSVALSSDGKLLATAARDGLVKLHDTSTWAARTTLEGHSKDVLDLEFSHDSSRLASASFDGAVKIWDVRDGKLVADLQGHESVVYAVSFSPDDRSLASVSYDKSLRLWNLAGARREPIARGHADRATSVSFGPDGEMLASGGTDHTVRLWDVASGKQKRVLRGHSAEVWGVSVSPDGRHIVSGSSDNSVRLWNADTGVQERVLGGHRLDVDDAQFSPTGRIVASGGADNTIRLWDVEHGVYNRALPSKSATIYRIGFNRDGSQLVAAGSGFRVEVWSLASGRLIASLDEHHDRVRDARFTSDGRVLSVGDKRALLREPGSSEVATLEHPQRVQTADAQPDGPLVVTGSADGIVRLWNPDDDEVRELRGHRAMVFLTRFSRDGKLVASAAQDGTVRLWDVEHGVPFWQAPLLLMNPPRLLTHTGWVPLTSETKAADLPTELDAALRTRARYATSHGEVMCLQTHGGEIELWDLASGAMQARVARPDAQRLHATGSACAVMTAGHVEVINRTGTVAKLTLGRRATALGDGDELLVATDREVLAFRPDFTVGQRVAVEVGVTALARKDDATFIVGYRDGSIELVHGGSSKSSVSSFERHPASAPSRIVPGPANTALVGFANGVVGMWDLADGRLLATVRLHGPIVHADRNEHALVAATDLGDAVHWDVSALSRDRCDLLRELWERTPVVWRDGRAVRQAPPTDHVCH